MIFDKAFQRLYRGTEIEQGVDMQDIWKVVIFEYVKFIIF